MDHPCDEDACEILCDNLEAWFATLEAGDFAVVYDRQQVAIQRRLAEEPHLRGAWLDASEG